MSAPFDPYVQWLGIRDPRRPPNHYRLLGLEPFEPDASVIALAADRQLAHIRTFQSGAHADAAQTLLNELTAIRICLLKPERKRQYDARLRNELQISAAPPPDPLAELTAQLSSPAVAARNAVSPSRRATLPLQQKKSLKPWLALGALSLVCAGLIYALATKYGGALEKPPASSAKNAAAPGEGKQAITAHNRNETPTSRAEKAAGRRAGETNTGAEPNQSNIPAVAELSATRGAPDAAAPNPAQGPESNRTPPLDKTAQAALSADAPELQLESTVPSPTGLPPELAGADLPTMNQTSASPAPAPPQHPPVPDKAALAAKEKEIRDLYKAEYQNPKLGARQALAQKLFAGAAENAADPAARYALLNEARNLAAQSGDLTLALRATDELSAAFGLNKGEERQALAMRLVALPNRSPEFDRGFLELLGVLCEDAVATDDFDAAVRYVNMAASLSKKLNDNALSTRITARGKELAQLKALYFKAKPAREALDKNDSDPEANETWGLYLCLVRGDFAAGLPLVSRGADADLAKLAQRELAEPKEVDERLAIADAWWELAEKQKDRARLNLRQHAGKLYLQAQPFAKGLAAAKVEKRLQEYQAELTKQDASLIEFNRQIVLRNAWTLHWTQGGGAEGEALVFLPDGGVRHKMFTRWSNDGKTVLLNLPAGQPDPLDRVARINVFPDRLELTYFELGKQANTAICKPVK